MKVKVNPHEALEEIRRQVGQNATKSYTRSGCSVSMAHLRSKPTNRVVLDVDLASPTNRAKTNQCDLILFHIDDVQNGLVGVPMELKGGGVDASEVIVQLREGARIVDNLAPKDVNINLVLVLVHGESMHKRQRNKLRTARIKFRNEEFPINTTTCSYQGNLAEALVKSTKR